MTVTNKATIHVLNGFIGSGKTTFAKKLELENNAVRFTVDEWMLPLFGEADMPREIFDQKINFLESQFKQMAETLIKKNVDVILDFGGWDLAERNQMRQWAQRLDAQLSMVYFDVDIQVCKQRALKRTADKTKNNYAFDEKTIDTLYAFFENPKEDEVFDVVVK